MHRKHGLHLLQCLCMAIASAPAARADVGMPPVFGNYMVLQRDAPIPIFGTATALESVTVEFAGQKKTTKAGTDGHWMLTLDPVAADGKNYELKVTGLNALTFYNVVVGDVYLCSGQSNMEMHLADADGGAEAIKNANDPLFRTMNLWPRAHPAYNPYNEAQLAKLSQKTFFGVTEWSPVNPKYASDFSAIGYFFGAALRKHAGGIPIGIIHNAIGGSPIESWIPRTKFASPELMPFYDKFGINDIKNPWCKSLIESSLANWPMEKQKVNIFHPYQPAYLYESGVAPIAPFRVRGVLWYQGESNAHRPHDYNILFPALVSSWRESFLDKELPFFVVQLPSFESESWPLFREFQRRLSITLPGVWLANAIDLGDPKEIHPRNKRDLADRLARLALFSIYKQQIVATGPRYVSAKTAGNTLRLTMAAADGMKARDGARIRGFEVAGEDHAFFPAEARVEGTEVVVTSEKVPTPRYARYAWAPVPDCNLINQEGLPLQPFTSEETLDRY